MNINIGQLFGDYKIIDILDRRNNNRYYKIKCMVCGHEKECGINNIKKQDNHHSCKNCREDYYGEFVGKEYGDYVCKSIRYISKQKGFMAEMECKVCGHTAVIHTSKVQERYHSASVCGTDYHESIIGEIFGDLEVIGIEEWKRGCAVVYRCRCSKCGVESVETMAQLKQLISHGTHCFKLLPNDEFKTAIFRRYNLMYQRCNNPNFGSYENYGGRGIKLLYDSAIDLYLDYIDDLRKHAKIYGLRNSTFDRIDVNGNYEKNNLRIVCQHIQSTNTRRRKVFILEKDGQRVLSDNAMECGRRLGINGHGVGNVVRGNSKSCGGWTLYRLVGPSENLEDVVNNEGVTTKVIVCDNQKGRGEIPSAVAPRSA